MRKKVIKFDGIEFKKDFLLEVYKQVNSFIDFAEKNNQNSKIKITCARLNVENTDIDINLLDDTVFFYDYKDVRDDDEYDCYVSLSELIKFGNSLLS